MPSAISDADIETIAARLLEASDIGDAIVDVDKTHIPGGLLFGVHTVSGNRAGFLRLAAVVLNAATDLESAKRDALFKAAEPLDAVLAQDSDRLIFARRDNLASELSRTPSKAEIMTAVGGVTLLGAVVPLASYALMLVGVYAIVRWIIAAMTA